MSDSDERDPVKLTRSLKSQRINKVVAVADALGGTWRAKAGRSVRLLDQVVSEDNAAGADPRADKSPLHQALHEAVDSAFGSKTQSRRKRLKARNASALAHRAPKKPE